jgi:predicted house-cleaning noncanonical NTP pyrophosphatase (MazG superfamily)
MVKKKKIWQITCPDCGGVMAESENYKEITGVEYTCDGPHDEPLTFIAGTKDLFQKREIVFNKLVRDRIPEIIKASGDECDYHIAGKQEFKVLLNQKLREEVEELIDNPCSEEIGDVLEVVEAIARLNAITLEDIKADKIRKKKERGGFNNRVVLENTTNNKNLTVVRDGKHVHLDLGQKKLDKDFKTSGSK